MPGLVDPLTFQQFADAARRGQLAPNPSGGGSSGVDGGGASAVTAGGGSGGPIDPRLAKILGQILLSDVKSRFSTGTSPSGAKWRPLKHARPNGGNVPLRDTGILMASFTAGHDGRSVWVGTTHPGASLHNSGGVVRGKGKMLAIPLTKEAKRSGGPRRWTAGELTFRPTRKPRVFLLMGLPAAAPKPPPKPKPNRAARRAKKKASLRKRIKKLVGGLVKKLRKKLLRKKRRAAKRASRRAGGGGSGGTRSKRVLESAVPVGQFLLVDQVTVPARPFMGVSERAWGQIGDAVAEASLRGWLTGPIGISIGMGR